MVPINGDLAWLCGSVLLPASVAKVAEKPFEEELLSLLEILSE
jgi:hypothetical protein